MIKTLIYSFSYLMFCQILRFRNGSFFLLQVIVHANRCVIILKRPTNLSIIKRLGGFYYNTPANSDHRVNLLKTIKFTHYVNDENKTQCRLQGPGGH